MKTVTRIALIFALLVPVCIGLFRLRLDPEVLNLLPADLPAVQGLRLYQDRFADANELIITLRATNSEISVSAAQAIASRLRQLTNQVQSVHWQPPWQENPAQSAELLAYIWLNRPPAEFAKVLEKFDFPQATNAMARARERLATSFSPAEIALASYDPLGISDIPGIQGAPGTSFGPNDTLFSSADGTFRVLSVQSRYPLKTYKECQRWLATVRSHATQALNEGFPEVRLAFTGRPAFTAEIAGGMEFDMTVSVIGTSVIIAVLFWLFHRRFRPMLWLLFLLALILGATLGLGGLVFGTISIVAVGFAAILLGLAVDYAVVHYQEALEHPTLSIRQIRRAIAPSITWAAVTTIVAFLVLNFGGLPGLAQLGTLVAIGVAVSALVMIFAYLPPLFPGRTQDPGSASPPGTTASQAKPLAIGISLGLVGVLLPAVLVWKGLPGVDASAEPLRPARSEAYSAMDELKRELTGNREPLWLLVQGADYEELAGRMAEAERTLQSARSNLLVTDFTLATPLVPRPAYQQANLSAVRQLRPPDLAGAAKMAGFSSNAVALAGSALSAWREAASKPAPFLPTNEPSRFVLQRVLSTGAQPVALGLLHLPTKGQQPPVFQTPGLIVSGWELLGQGVYQRVRQNLWFLLTPVVMLVLGALWLAFRSWKEISLSVGVLALSAGLLLGVMALAGWSWNLLNLMAIPLIIGTGVDYSIFTQLALRRHGGDHLRTFRSVGRALLLCGGTAIAGFGSLAWSGNLGMAGLGKVCATGIALNMLISVFLLPHWWTAVARRGGVPAEPSSFYSVYFWKAGLTLARWLPHRLLEKLARTLLLGYWAVAPHRRRIVFDNLLPIVAGDARRARRATRKLFANFGVKLIDLWRYESGANIDDLFGSLTGWDHFVAAQATGRGVLLVTVHLGNWEFGGPCLTRKGVPLQVLTLAEPGDRFTALRQASRARWKVDTLVVRNDPFAFLEPMRRLESGATVALLIDRPPPPTAVEARIFGRTIQVSNAAAELARASGCVVLPVGIWRENGAYSVRVMPPVAYERARLREREARQQFTQKIIECFAPLIAQHLDQWYHFVPAWPDTEPKK